MQRLIRWVSAFACQPSVYLAVKGAVERTSGGWFMRVPRNARGLDARTRLDTGRFNNHRPALTRIPTQRRRNNDVPLKFNLSLLFIESNISHDIQHLINYPTIIFSKSNFTSFTFHLVRKYVYIYIYISQPVCMERQIGERPIPGKTLGDKVNPWKVIKKLVEKGSIR